MASEHRVPAHAVPPTQTQCSATSAAWPRQVGAAPALAIPGTTFPTGIVVVSPIAVTLRTRFSVGLGRPSSLFASARWNPDRRWDASCCAPKVADSANPTTRRAAHKATASARARTMVPWLILLCQTPKRMQGQAGAAVGGDIEDASELRPKSCKCGDDT